MSPLIFSLYPLWEGLVMSSLRGVILGILPIVWGVVVTVISLYFFCFFAPNAIVGYVVYVMHLKRTRKDKWTRACSCDQADHLSMYDTGMAWSEEHKEKKKDVHIVSEGLNLYGEFYDFGSDKTVILVAGRTEGLRYGYYFARPYSDCGYNVLTIDNRAHGESEGTYNTVGFEEHKDLLAWANYIHENHHSESIVFHGICIGSAGSLYALTSENLRVEGITTCFGNSGAAQSAENSIRLVKLSGCGYDVPVVVGAECSIDGEYQASPKHIHGENGIGNVELPKPSQQPLAMSAEDFIIQKAEELSGELILVTTGRLTNLAKALMKDPKLPRKIKRVVAMGGCLNTHGNVTPYAEANIYGDARAADMVLRAGFNMILVGLDVTTRTFITQKDLENLDTYCAEENRPVAEYIQRALKHYFEFHRLTEGMVGSCFSPLR